MSSSVDYIFDPGELINVLEFLFRPWMCLSSRFCLESAFSNVFQTCFRQISMVIDKHKPVFKTISLDVNILKCKKSVF